MANPFDLTKFKEKLQETPVVVPKEEEYDPDARKRTILSEISNCMLHHKRIVFTDEMHALGLLPKIYEMIQKHDGKLKLKHLLCHDDDGYVNPYPDDNPKFEDCL